MKTGFVARYGNRLGRFTRATPERWLRMQEAVDL